METTEDSVTVQATAEGAEGETTTASNQEVKTEPSKKSNEDVYAQLENLSKQVRGLQSKTDQDSAELGRTKKELAEERRLRETAESTINRLRREYVDDPTFSDNIQRTEKDSRLESFEKREKAEQEAMVKQRAMMEHVAETKRIISKMGVDPGDPIFNEVAKTVRPYDVEGLRNAFVDKAIEISKGAKKVEEAKDSKYDELMAQIDNLKKQLNSSDDVVPPTGVTKSAKGWTKETVKGMSPEDLIKNAKEIAKLELTI